jgi:hypothetical protein
MRSQLHAQPLYPRRWPSCPLNRSLGGSYRGAGRFGEQKNRTPAHPTSGLFTATTTLFRPHQGSIAEMRRRLLLISTSIASDTFFSSLNYLRNDGFIHNVKTPRGTALIEVPKLMFMKTGNRHGAIS